MCGIAGIFLTPRKADPGRLERVKDMASSLRHRGPDDGGIWVDRQAGIAFGHRRLAIIDLSEHGRQPMFSRSGDLVIAYNGEVYNFVELREELESRGEHFAGHSDTEVMLSAFERYGIEESLKKFAGMFALGLWDRKRRMLHLVRDRIGKKPLYIAAIGGGLLFASELKGLLAYPEFEATIDPHALAVFMQNGWVPEGSCIWKDVFKLPPGAMLSIDADDLETATAESMRSSCSNWWSLDDVASIGQRQPLECDVGELEDQLDKLLRLVVRQRMISDVPIGAFLSGGVDSSVIVALMQQQSSTPINTYSIGFSGTHYDEAPHAAEVAKHFGTNHTEFNVSASEAQSVISNLPDVWDEPFADESQIPMLHLTRLARQHVTVALSGDGGDECFGGYSRHVLWNRLAPMFQLPLPIRKGAMSALSMLSSDSWAKLVDALKLNGGWEHNLRSASIEKFMNIIDVPDEQAFYNRLIKLSPGSERRGDAANGTFHLPELASSTNRLIYRDMVDYLPGDILVKTDRASMAASLEVRCPLLDHRLIEFVWQLPMSAKIKNNKGKVLLRRVLARYLPPALFERPKHGFNVPVGDWLRGPLQDWAQDILMSSDNLHSGLLDNEHIELCWRQHQSGQRDHGRELWAALMFYTWMASVKDRTVLATVVDNPGAHGSLSMVRASSLRSEGY